jgi:hypothetical protein
MKSLIKKTPSNFIYISATNKEKSGEMIKVMTVKSRSGGEEGGCGFISWKITSTFCEARLL